MKPNFEQYRQIPGTTIFTIELAQLGFELNQFCMTLRSQANRDEFHADERAYVDKFAMTEEQKRAVLDRDFQRMLDLGGNVYFLSKIFASDGLSYVEAVSTMTDMTVEQYKQMMLDGGRNPNGQPNKQERG